MRPLTAQAVVEAWTRGREASPGRRPLALLSAALPESAGSDLAELSPGQRDSLLLEVRESTLGGLLNGYARCDECGAVLNFDLDAAEIRQEAPSRPEDEAEVLRLEDWEVRFRRLSCRDLVAVEEVEDPNEGRARLLEMAVLEARQGGRAVSARELPAVVVEAISDRMEALDPLGEVPVDLYCEACENRWTILLEIGSFFWAELAGVAERLMYEVHRLARSYGWSEQEVLAMGPERRRYYLELASSE